MSGISRQTILIFVLGVVVIAPLLESFDRSDDLEHGTDLVLVLLCTFVSIGLFTVCKRIISSVLRFSLIEIIAGDSAVLFSNRPIQVEIPPPRFPMPIDILRI